MSTPTDNSLEQTACRASERTPRRSRPPMCLRLPAWLSHQYTGELKASTQVSLPEKASIGSSTSD